MWITNEQFRQKKLSRTDDEDKKIVFSYRFCRSCLGQLLWRDYCFSFFFSSFRSSPNVVLISLRTFEIEMRVASVWQLLNCPTENRGDNTDLNGFRMFSGLLQQVHTSEKVFSRKRNNINHFDSDFHISSLFFFSENEYYVFAGKLKF